MIWVFLWDGMILSQVFHNTYSLIGTKFYLGLNMCLQEPLFFARVIYDLLFFFIVIIIVLNLIFGVIIDTFADLRSEKQQKEEILKNSCFICG